MPESNPNKYSRVSSRVDSIPSSGIRRFFDLIASSDDIISLGVGEPDFITPWNIREAAIYSIERGHTHYTSNSGTVDLRREDPRSSTGICCIRADCSYGWREICWY